MSDAETIRRLARMSARSVYCPSDMPYAEAVSVASVAVAEALAAGLTNEQLILRRANLAITHEARQRRKFRGLVAHEGGRTHPGYVRYWVPRLVRGASFADDLIESIAVLQVYWALSERDREVLWMEACGEREDRPGWRRIVQRSRQAAWRLWYDHETPPSARIRRAHYSRRTA